MCVCLCVCVCVCVCVLCVILTRNSFKAQLRHLGWSGEDAAKLLNRTLQSNASELPRRQRPAFSHKPRMLARILRDNGVPDKIAVTLRMRVRYTTHACYACVSSLNIGSAHITLLADCSSDHFPLITGST